MSEGLIGVAAAARILQVHENTIRNWTKQGYLVPIRTPGGQARYYEQDVQALASTLSARSRTALEGRLMMLEHQLEQARSDVEPPRATAAQPRSSRA
jgi:DNA-binding transcriptional MerR regulator